MKAPWLIIASLDAVLDKEMEQDKKCLVTPTWAAARHATARRKHVHDEQLRCGNV